MRGSGGLFSVYFKWDDIKKMEAFCDKMTAVFQLAVSWSGHESLQIPNSKLCVLQLKS